MRYAQHTDVPVEKSRAEIEALLIRYGAEKFMVGSDQKKAVLAFQIRGKMVQFTLPLPSRTDKQFTHFTRGHVNPREYPRDEALAFKSWEQACRSSWRALRLCIQAKLEAVACGITTFESEFLAHFVMPDGHTIGEHLIPKIDDVAKSGKLPQLLLGMGD